MSEQLEGKGTIVLANLQPQKDSGQNAISLPDQPILRIRFRATLARGIPHNPSESSDETSAARAMAIITEFNKTNPVVPIKPSAVPRSLHGSINQYALDIYEGEKLIPEGQGNLALNSDVIEAPDGSVIGIEQIGEAEHLLLGQSASGNNNLVPFNRLAMPDTNNKTRVYDLGGFSTRKDPLLNTTYLEEKKAA